MAHSKIPSNIFRRMLPQIIVNLEGEENHYLELPESYILSEK